MLPDQKMLIVGDFTKYDGQMVNRIARLNADGSLDKSFHYGPGADLAVSDITPLKDGGYLLVGAFNAYDGHAVAHGVKIDANGSYDHCLFSWFETTAFKAATSVQIYV